MEAAKAILSCVHGVRAAALGLLKTYLARHVDDGLRSVSLQTEFYQALTSKLAWIDHSSASSSRKTRSFSRCWETYLIKIRGHNRPIRKLASRQSLQCFLRRLHRVIFDEDLAHARGLSTAH